MIKERMMEILFKREIDLSQETTGHAVTRKKDDRLDQYKVYSFNELGVHSHERQRTQHHLYGTEQGIKGTCLRQLYGSSGEIIHIFFSLHYESLYEDLLCLFSLGLKKLMSAACCASTFKRKCV